MSQNNKNQNVYDNNQQMVVHMYYKMLLLMCEFVVLSECNSKIAESC